MTVKYNNICWENVIAGSLIFVNKSFDYQNKNQIYSQLGLYCCKESWSHCDEGEESPAPSLTLTGGRWEGSGKCAVLQLTQSLITELFHSMTD